MAKQAKPKAGASRNDSRSNGKAGKQNPGRRHTGSKSGRLDEGTKILLGKGLYIRYERMNNDGLRAMANKKGKKKS